MRVPIMPDSKLDVLQGALDVMVLQTLEQVSENEILLNQGTIYTSLVRLQQRGWIAAAWGVSENNRKAKFQPGVLHFLRPLFDCDPALACPKQL
jgi:hypothetical protein